MLANVVVSDAETLLIVQGEAVCYGVPPWAFAVAKGVLIGLGVLLLITANQPERPAGLVPALNIASLAMLLAGALLPAGFGMVHFVADRRGLLFPQVVGAPWLPGQRPLTWLLVPWANIVLLDNADVPHAEGGSGRGIACRLLATDCEVSRTFGPRHRIQQVTDRADGVGEWEVRYINAFHPPPLLLEAVRTLRSRE